MEVKRRETQLPPRPQLSQRHVLHNGIGGSWWRAMARLANALNTSKPVDRLSGRALRRVVGDRGICADTRSWQHKQSPPMLAVDVRRRAVTPCAF